MLFDWATQRQIAARFWGHQAPVSKLCLHTTEGDSLEGAWRTLNARKVPSHLLSDLRSDLHWQLLDTKYAAHSLYHVDRSGVIQVELVGYAAEIGGYDDQWYSRLARLIRRVCDAHGIPLVFTNRAWPATANAGYGKNAGQRMSFDEWDAFSGIVGHCHAPAKWWLPNRFTNGHWDPGGLDVDRLRTYLYQPSKDPKMNLVIDTEGPDAGGHYIVGMPKMVDVTHSSARSQHVEDFEAAGAVLPLRYGGDIVRKGYGLSN